MRIFWDTNVLVDLLMVRRPFYESASTILTMSEENNWQIIVSSLSVMNQCSCIVTRNTRDFRMSSLPVFEPDDFILKNQ